MRGVDVSFRRWLHQHLRVQIKNLKMQSDKSTCGKVLRDVIKRPHELNRLLNRHAGCSGNVKLDGQCFGQRIFISSQISQYVL